MKEEFYLVANEQCAKLAMSLNRRRKMKTTIIKILVENQNSLNRLSWESNATQLIKIVTWKSKQKLNIPKTEETNFSGSYETLYIDDNEEKSNSSYGNSSSSSEEGSEETSGNT